MPKKDRYISMPKKNRYTKKNNKCPCGLKEHANVLVAGVVSVYYSVVLIS
jgi:hypothetical protein